MKNNLAYLYGRLNSTYNLILVYCRNRCYVIFIGYHRQLYRVWTNIFYLFICIVSLESKDGELKPL